MKDRLLNRFIIFCFTLVVLMGLTGCSQTETQLDILTQKPTEKGRTQITVLVKQAFSINTFEKAVEEKFSDIDLVQVGCYTSALVPDEYVARLAHDDLTDIIMTWPLSFGEEYWADRLLDLSALPITTRYNVSMLNTISRDGKLYYLPGPAQVRGIVYNKTLFEEKGWKVPQDFDGFVQLCQTIEESGIRSIQLGFQNAEVLDTAFVGYSYADCFSSPKDAQWIADYGAGKGEFLDHFGAGLDTFQTMIDEGIWKKEDLAIDYSQREQLLFTRQCAMIEDSVLIARSGYKFAGNTDEFALMPFFNPGGTENDWARLYMVCYIGLNKHLAEPQNKEIYEKVLRVMDYISTPEGQEALAGDTGAMYSSLKGVQPPNVSETQDIVSALEHGRYAIFPELARVQSTLRKGLAGMLEGKLTQEDVGQMVDQANATGVGKQLSPEVLGKAETDFTLIETGSFVTDVMREYGSCDVALFLDGGKDGQYNHKGITARLYQGDLTIADIRRIMPDLQYGQKGELWMVTMTGKNLIQTLEYSIASDSNSIGWFYYFSGIKASFEPIADMGSRVKDVTLADGTKIDPEREYRIAIMENTVPDDYIISCEKTGTLIGTLLEDAIRTRKTISPARDGRFTIIQAQNPSI